MSSFIRRLKYYGIGFGIGLVLVFFFFQNRGCSWLPGNRVKNAILERVLVLPDSEWKFMEQSGITEDEIISVLNDGDILYDKSRKDDGELKSYVLEKEFNGEKREFIFTLPTESFISEVYLSRKDLNNLNSSVSGSGKLIHFPNDEGLIFPDTTSRLTCAQNYFKLMNPKDILKGLNKNGTIAFEKSKLDLSPKPEHHLVFTTENGGAIEMRAIWYKNKINVLEIYNVPDSVYQSCKANDVHN